MKKEITLSDIAGYATEKTVWQMIRSLADDGSSKALGKLSHDDIVVRGNIFETIIDGEGANKHPGIMATECNCVFAAPETFSGKASGVETASNVWSIGAVAFYAIMGTDIFEGKGGKTQMADTAIPIISSSHASLSLSDLIRRCLSFLPADRPTLGEIRQQAARHLCHRQPPKRRRWPGCTEHEPYVWHRRTLRTAVESLRILIYREKNSLYQLEFKNYCLYLQTKRIKA